MKLNMVQSKIQLLLFQYSNMTKEKIYLMFSQYFKEIQKNGELENLLPDKSKNCLKYLKQKQYFNILYQFQ